MYRLSVKQKTGIVFPDQKIEFRSGWSIRIREFASQGSPVQTTHWKLRQTAPAPKLDATGRLNEKLATASELSGEKLFFGKARCAVCHPAPFFLDNQLHDLRVERFTGEAPVGPIKTFTLRGIKESPPYIHDGRCLTLDDTVEFFNLVLELHLTAEEKSDLVAYLRTL